MTSSGRSARSLMIKVANCSNDGSCRALSRLAVFWHASGKIVRTEVANACTKTGSSLSRSSRENQADERPLDSSHSTSRVVFPKPAGAHTSVILPPSPLFKPPRNRSREMTSLRARGRKNLVRLKILPGIVSGGSRETEGSVLVIIQLFQKGSLIICL